LGSPAFRELLLRRVSGFCELSAYQIEQLYRHYQLLLKWNQRINLTAITDLAELVDRHYAESLFLGSKLPSVPLRIADVGSGAGFPGIPVAVLRPDCLVTLIESDQRKAVFLKEASRSVGDFTVVAKRAEGLPNRFDWVLSRAVAPQKIAQDVARLAPKWGILGNEGEPLPWDSSRAVELRST